MSTINRRTFLKQTTSTIAGLGLASAPTFAVNTAPKKIRIGIVGGGSGEDLSVARPSVFFTVGAVGGVTMVVSDKGVEGDLLDLVEKL